MSEELYTVEAAAGRLKLHPKTVLRAIREGRLAATRVGKSYRIRRSDFEAFAGLPARSATGAEPQVTAIVELPDIAPEFAQKWARTVTNALNAKPMGGSPMRADVVYDPDRRRLKIILLGPPADTINLMNLIRVWIEQLQP